jgi:hypothetical protein
MLNFLSKYVMKVSRQHCPGIPWRGLHDAGNESRILDPETEISPKIPANW